jgi:hypothetical protein
MTIVVFVGPTLPPEDIAACKDIVCLPPVAQGDIYRAAQRRPRAIGIIDGYFSGVPSVWHKEIVWAISRGVPVFGSASMGALRAAELHAFGMRGVGRIFEAFRDGELEDDDEVAVVHGPAELGHVQASEAMVNIRATLARAETVGILSKSSRSALEAFGKSMFFPHRSWEALLEGAAALGVAEPQRAALSAWLTEGRVDQKRADALEMLAAIRDAAQESSETQPKYSFEWTQLWDEFLRRFETGEDNPGASTARRIVEELRLEGPEAYARVEAMALLRRVAVTGGAPMAPSRAPDSLRTTLTDIRARLGLFTRADLDRWMARNDLDVVSMERLVADEASLAILRDRSSAGLESFLIDELRLSGAYERLVERARRKSDVLGAMLAGKADAPSGSQALALRLWYFESRLRRPLSDDVEDFARRLGFADAADFDAALLRERLYLNEQEADQKRLT